MAVVGDSLYGVVCTTSRVFSAAVRRNGIARLTNVESLSVLRPHVSVRACAGGNRYVTR